MPDDVDNLKSILINVKPSSDCCVSLFFLVLTEFQVVLSVVFLKYCPSLSLKQTDRWKAV